MKIPIVALMLTYCLATQGQVLVYKQKLTDVVSGGGRVDTYQVSGYFLLDIKDNTRMQVLVWPKQKRCRITNLDDWRVSGVRAPDGKVYTVLSHATTSTDGQSFEMIKGLRSYVDIGAPDSNGNMALWPVPKTMRWTRRGVDRYPFLEELSFDMLREGSGTLVLDLKRTQTSNRRGYSIYDVFYGILDELSDYTEVQ